MARTETLANLRTASRRRADVVNSNFVTDAEVNDYVNASISSLYDLLASAHSADYYESHVPYTFTTTSNEEHYALPADFYSLSRIQQNCGGVWRDLHEYMPDEASGSEPVESGLQMRIYYIPVCTKLVLDSDTFDGINGWEEYVIIDTAIKIRIKEDTDTSALERQLANVVNRILNLRSKRDRQRTTRIVDAYFDASQPDHCSYTSTRYRIRGQRISLIRT